MTVAVTVSLVVEMPLEDGVKIAYGGVEMVGETYFLGIAVTVAVIKEMALEEGVNVADGKLKRLGRPMCWESQLLWPWPRNAT